MQTERVTFLTSRDHKAALDAYASENGQSVGHLLREASVQYMAPPSVNPKEEAELATLVAEANAAIPKMHASLERMIARLEESNRKNDEFLRKMGVR